MEVAASAPNEAARPERGERRPPRERAHGEGGNSHARPSRQVTVTAAKPAEQAVPSPKAGFFRRLSRFFTGR
jgi:ATP-dependent RNA helicase RhlB